MYATTTVIARKSDNSGDNNLSINTITIAINTERQTVA